MKTMATKKKAKKAGAKKASPKKAKKLEPKKAKKTTPKKKAATKKAAPKATMSEPREMVHSTDDFGGAGFDDSIDGVSGAATSAHALEGSYE